MRFRRLAAFVLCFCWFRSPIAGQGQPDASARGTGNVQVTGTAQFEAWDYNNARERLAGGTLTLGYFFLDRWSVDGEAAVLRVNESPSDATILTLSELVRWHVHPRLRLSPFVELGAGLAWAPRRVPPSGTTFNFVLQAGGGATYRLSDRWHLVGGLRWFHLSNNGREGNNRNPDIQALGAYGGVLIPF